MTRKYDKQYDEFSVGEIKRTCTIHEYQDKFIRKKKINFSMLIRKLLKEEIEKRKLIDKKKEKELIK